MVVGGSSFITIQWHCWPWRYSWKRSHLFWLGSSEQPAYSGFWCYPRGQQCSNLPFPLQSRHCWKFGLLASYHEMLQEVGSTLIMEYWKAGRSLMIVFSLMLVTLTMFQALPPNPMWQKISAQKHMSTFVEMKRNKAWLQCHGMSKKGTISSVVRTWIVTENLLRIRPTQAI